MSEMPRDDQDLAVELPKESPATLFFSEGDYPEDGEHQFDMARLNRISQTFLDSGKMREAFKSDGIVRCMDGGTEGGLRMAGSGILLPRAKLALPKNHPMVVFFREFGIELTGESTEVLLPNEHYFGILQGLVEKRIIKGISAHTECGAANGDLGRILPAIGIKEETIKKMTSDPRWQSVVDAHAKLFSETLALKLGVGYSWIPLEEMTRESHGHVEEAFYVDLIGGSRPNMAFNSSKLLGDVPNGFTIHPELSDWVNIFHRIEISLDIAKVGKRFSPENPFVIFLIDDPEKSRVTKPIIEGIRKAVKKFGNHVIIKQVSPNFGN